MAIQTWSVTVKFAQIADVGFKGEIGVSGFFDIGGAEADKGQGHIGILVKQHIVIGHVEMAVVVDPLAFNGVGGAFDGAWKNHRNFLPVC